MKLTANQQQTLGYLTHGWQCQCVGTAPTVFGRFVWYYFSLGARHTYVSGSTLTSLQRRGLIAWQEASVRLAYDQSIHPGWTLTLTQEGARVYAITQHCDDDPQGAHPRSGAPLS